jgi:hypothetical protein
MITYAQKRAIVRARQEREAMREAGYRRHETDWEIHRGGAFGQVILDVKISADRKEVWTKVGYPEGATLLPRQQHMFRQVQTYGVASPTREQLEANGEWPWG